MQYRHGFMGLPEIFLGHGLMYHPKLSRLTPFAFSCILPGHCFHIREGTKNIQMYTPFTNAADMETPSLFSLLATMEQGSRVAVQLLPVRSFFHPV
jgi:hypothetical protein